jgi:hypothetical protein
MTTTAYKTSTGYTYVHSTRSIPSPSVIHQATPSKTPCSKPTSELSEQSGASSESGPSGSR